MRDWVSLDFLHPSDKKLLKIEVALLSVQLLWKQKRYFEVELFHAAHIRSLDTRLNTWIFKASSVVVFFSFLFQSWLLFEMLKSCQWKCNQVFVDIVRSQLANTF